MPISFATLSLVIAVVLFALGSISKIPQPFPFIAAGLAFFALAFLLGAS